MALTQKRVRERIEELDELIVATVSERNELTDLIAKKREDSNSIDLMKDESFTNLLDEYAGLTQTIQDSVGRRNELSDWVIPEMRRK